MKKFSEIFLRIIIFKTLHIHFIFPSILRQPSEPLNVGGHPPVHFKIFSSAISNDFIFSVI